MRAKVLITPRSFLKVKEQAQNLLKRYDLDLIYNDTGKTLTEEQMLKMCEDVDGLIVGIDPVTEKVLKNARKLKAISKYGAGLDNIDLKTARELGIKVASASGTNATSVAELAIGMFFALARNLAKHVFLVKNGGWDRIQGVELTGKTAGIIGLGNIGKEVARLASGIGMRIIAYDPYFEDGEFLKKYEIKMVSLESVFKEADFVTLHVPLTEATAKIVNENTLKLMKKTAYIVNTSRGGLIDEDALYEALKNDKIAGAASDVFSKEPPGFHKLLTLDNFLLTPHIGAYTAEAVEKMAIKSIENLVRMLFEEK